MKNNSRDKIVLIEPIDGIKVVASEHPVKRIRPFQYPIRCSIFLEMKRPMHIDSTVRDSISEFVEDRMRQAGKSEAVLVCSTKNRIPRSRRKDKMTDAPIADAKIVITSREDVYRAVEVLFQRLASLGERITVDGLKAVIGLGAVNTLEVLSEPGQEDTFNGF